MHGTFKRPEVDGMLNVNHDKNNLSFDWNGGGRMYAIAFDLDTERLQQSYGSESWQNAYSDIRRVLEKHGFRWQQGSVYFGAEGINSVHCVIAVQSMANTMPWFRFCVRDIRMLRIEETNNLMPAVDPQAPLGL